MKFRAKVLLSGKSATGIEVPARIVECLGSRRPAITVAINGHRFRTTLGSMNGKPMISLSAENRTKAAASAGQEVEIDVDLDTKARTCDAPPDLLGALTRDANAERFFKQLSYSRQLAYVTWIESARKSETRERRVTETCEMLAQGRKR